MSVQFTEYTESHTEAVIAFNARLRAGGMNMQFPTEPVPAWLPPAEGQRLYQRQYVALDEHAQVRGGFILKHQDFKIGDATVSIADLRLPISEGTVDRQYAGVATDLLFHSLAKQPLLFGMGIGGYHEPVAKWFLAAGWRLFTIPFFFRVLRPYRFCRKIRFLRRSLPRRLVLDTLALTGIGWLGLKTIERVRGRAVLDPAISVELVDQFDAWSDDLWQRCDHEYPMIAVRSRGILNRLYPCHDSRFLRLKVSRHGEPIGWCVMLDTELNEHKQFGSLRLGSIVDGFASTVDARHVVNAATCQLAQRGVDLIVSNQGHDAWCEAFRNSGFLQGPSNFLFAASRKLSKLLDDAQVDDGGKLFINRGDGDGPINL